MGGRESSHLKTLEVFAPATNTWTTGPDMPTARDGLAAATIGGNLYVVGGYRPPSRDRSSYLRTLEILSW